MDLLKGLPEIRRRGPDSHTLWASKDNYVALLHARLAIVDPDSRANQPISDPGSQVTVCFIGEIYNYRELKYQFSGYSFKTTSDTEVILASYVLHGLNGLKMLKGMYSIVVVDERQKKVFLLRDAVGKKPLFLARWDGQTLFGCSLIPLIRTYGGEVGLNPAGVESFWRNKFVSPETTIFKDAKPVFPGQVVELNWDGDARLAQRILPEPLLLYQGEPYDKVQQNIQSLLMRAVKRRLESRYQPVLLLSGGIDSTVVSLFAKRVFSQGSGASGLRVLTLGATVYGAYDDLFSAYVARRIHIQRERIQLQLGRIPQQALEAINLQDEPLGMVSFFLLERLVAAAAQRSRILITGDGGDEIFLGYGKAVDWRGSRHGGTSSYQPASPFDSGLPAWMSPWGKRMAGWSLIGHVFAKADRASAEQGVELRAPLLDWDLVAYARSLPFEILAEGNRTKAVLRNQLRGWPIWFLNRPKVGFSYNLRWLWLLANFDGIRENIDDREIRIFETEIPACFRKAPSLWKSVDIHRYFQKVWMLLVWSQFMKRYRRVRTSLSV